MAKYGPQFGQTDKYGKPKRNWKEKELTPKETKEFLKKFKEDQKKN